MLRMQAGTCVFPCVNSDVVVMWCIPPPNSSPSFEVSAIFPAREIEDIDDIFANGKSCEYAV